MHLLFTVNASWNIVNFRLPLIQALLADGHRITILAPTDNATRTLTDLGCDHVPLRISRGGLNPLGEFAVLRQFRAAFGKARPNIVFGFTIKNNIYGAIAARLTGIPFIPNVTGLGTAFLSSSMLRRVVERLYRTAFAKAPIVFFQNADDRTLFIARGLVAQDRARLLPGSGIDLDRFRATPYPPSKGPVRVLMIARVLRDKGVLEFVEAARMLHPRGDIAFTLLGGLDTANRTAIPREGVRRWEEEGILTYAGEADDVRPFIAEAHCVVLPSYREGAPRTLIEAAALARPLIATDVPGCRAVMDDGVNGYLCAPRNGASLAAAIERFCALSHAEQRAMGEASRSKAEGEFSVDRIIAAYRGVIADHGGSPGVCP